MKDESSGGIMACGGAGEGDVSRGGGIENTAAVCG